MSTMSSYVMEHFTVTDQSVYDRYIEVAEAVKNDAAARGLLGDLVKSAERYFSAVVHMEHRLKIEPMEGEALREATESMDRARHMAHEALIANLHAFNRYVVREHGVSIFPWPDRIRDRVAIADWAGQLLCELYRRRRR